MATSDSQGPDGALARRTDIARQHAAAILLQQRGTGPDPFERVNDRRLPGRRFRPVLVGGRGNAYEAGDELLVLNADLDETRRTQLRDLGFELRLSRVLRDRVVQLVKPYATDADIDAVRRVMGEDRARPSYVTAHRMIIKSGATPEDATDVVPQHTDEAPSTVRVAVLDTGITAEQRADGWLRGLLSTTNEDPLNVLPEGNPDPFLDLAAGHGTFVAGVVAQVAPRANLRAHRVLDTDGVATDLQVAEALVQLVLEDLATDGRLVVNLSLGTETPDDRPPLAMQEAVAVVKEIAAERRGEVMLVAAAGNEGRERECWPAAFDDVVAVAALGLDTEPAAWSSFGAWVNCSTVGEAVLSTYVEGRESPLVDPQPETFGPDAWAYWTGTSFCAPQVAARVADLADRNSCSLEVALGSLVNQAFLPDQQDGFGPRLRIL